MSRVPVLGALADVEQINAQWKRHPPGERLWKHIRPFSQTITRAAVTYKRKSPHGPVGRKRSQTTNRVAFTDPQRTDAPTGLAVGRTQRGSGEEGCFNALTFSVDPGLSRSNSLHKTTPSFRELWRNASGSEMVFFGDSRTPSVINHVTVCSAEFMSSRNRSRSKKAAVFGFSTACRPGYAVIVEKRNTVNPL